MFSQRDFFKTVFAGGDDEVEAQAQLKKNEIDDWKGKVVVENAHFYVNTKPKHSLQTDKYKGILEGGEGKKIGFMLGSKQLKHLTRRQIGATKGAPIPPVNNLKEERWIMDEWAH